MKYRRMGKLATNVSCIGFGGAAISGENGGYSFGFMSDQEADTLLKEAVSLGINVFDTAPIYGFGSSETRIGALLTPENREDFIIATKGGYDWDGSKNTRIDNTPSTILRMLHQSLRNLQTEYVDVYFVHKPDPHTDIRKTMEVLMRAKEQEKIRSIGLSNFSLEEIEKAMEVGRVDALQDPLNVFRRDVTKEIIPYVNDHNMGFMAYGTFDQGILTGQATPDRFFDPSDYRGRMNWAKKAKLHQKNEALDEIIPFLNERGLTLVQLALGYVLGFEDVSTALCGIRSVEQLHSTIEAMDCIPSQEIYDEVIAIAEDYLEEF